MRVVNKKIKLVLIIMLVIIEISSLYLVYKSFSNKDIILESVRLKEEIDSNMFAIMIEQSDGTYAESTDNAWPEDKIYNEEMSGCIDANGKKIEGALTYDDVNNIATVETSDTTFCYLYFDSTIEDVEFAYTGDYQEYTAKTTGYYFIEAYGASGGDASTYTGSMGAYTSGVIKLSAGETLYIYVGGKGEDGISSTYTTTSGGYNGGGAGYVGGTAYYVSGGGGATDIRYFGSTNPSTDDLVWNSELGLNSRIMVAAGGGGKAYYTSSYRTITAGSGGYLIGNDAIGKSNSSSTTGSGGKQNGAGATGTVKGSFGIGASAGTNSGDPGAGGGYYGGNTSAYAGGGGSSFISGYAGVNAITSSTDRTHTDNTLHYSGKYFINGRMEIYANQGNGSAKIAYLGKNKPNSLGANYDNVRYIKDCKGYRTIVTGDDTDNDCYKCRNWREIQAIKDGVNLAKGKTITIDGSVSSWVYPQTNATDGIITSAGVAYASSDDGIVCAIVDLGDTYDLDEIAVWDLPDAYFANHTLSVSNDGSTWQQIASIGAANGIQGTRGNPYSTLVSSYSYSGTEKTLEISTSGCYKLEVWGASGGSTSGSGAVYTLRGGIGGYSRGYKYLEAGQNLYINVGGAGSDVNKWAVASGGYNGGGNGSGINSSNSTSQGNIQAAGGGGATHIATSSGLLSALSSNKESVLIVAGGGGGSASNEGNYDEGYYAYHYGGSAGGYKGNGSVNYTYASGTGWATFTLSTGGSQTSGGIGGHGWEGTYNPNVCDTSSTPYRCYIGRFGQGGTLSDDWTTTNASYGGGGGGYYGGGMGYYMAGGGGSSYIGGVDSLALMSCMSCSTTKEASIRTINYGDFSYYATSNIPKRGNGYARIHYVGTTCPSK